MSDYIKREDAIKAFDPSQRRDWYTPWIVETLEGLPSADVVPMEWYKSMENTCVKLQKSLADVAPVRHEEDGTLWVTVGDCEKVGRVIVKNELGHFCRVFYMGDGDEEPVRHGEWIHPTEYGLNLPEHYCSECGAWEYSDTESNYCPNCGAKMDE